MWLLWFGGGLLFLVKEAIGFERICSRFLMVRRVLGPFFSPGCVLMGPITTAAGCGVEHAGRLVLELSGRLA